MIFHRTVELNSSPNCEFTSNVLHTAETSALITRVLSPHFDDYIQGDHSGSSQPPVDIKMNVAFHFMLLML